MSIKVKELLEILKNVNPETKVLVRFDGSIFPTDNLDEHLDYNYDTTNSPGEYYILAMEEFDNDDDWLRTLEEPAQEQPTDAS